jgi:hypothetical protein
MLTVGAIGLLLARAAEPWGTDARLTTPRTKRGRYGKL